MFNVGGVRCIEQGRCSRAAAPRLLSKFARWVCPSQESAYSIYMERIHSALLTISFFVTACSGVTGGNVSVACKSLTGRYEIEGGGTREITQDGCGPKVNIENKTIGINGQSISQTYVLDGIRKLEAGATELNYRFYTRSWKDDQWIDKWERYENGLLQSTTTSLFYLDSQGNMIYQDGDRPEYKILYRRIK
jgi:hypothetical protein